MSSFRANTQVLPYSPKQTAHPCGRVASLWRRRETKSHRGFRPVEKCGKLTRACRQVCVQINA
ncbi:MAG: hypothetical protein LBD52_08830 [Prevotellaceae bacterium]|nr:hypothetical protein [Prevotellaceae bacterium]